MNRPIVHPSLGSFGTRCIVLGLLGVLVLAVLPDADAGEPAAGAKPDEPDARPAKAADNAGDKDAGFERAARPFLSRYCFECHGPKQQKSKVRFDRYASVELDSLELWRLALQKAQPGLCVHRNRG